MDCIFCQIVAGEIPGEITYQDESIIAFRDINPQAPTHLLIIPKRHIPSLLQLSEADLPLIGHLVNTANQLAKQEGISPSGYRLAISCGKEGRNHIEESFSHLSPFGTPFAITACRVLALRMNCFKLFRKCGATSRFNVVNLFFNNQDAKFDISNNFTGKKWENQEYGVYIDNYTEIFLGALNAYYGNDYGVLDELCLKLNESLNDADRNNRDKLTLLQARIAYKKKDELTFQRLYELLLNHPDFGIEAKEMLS